MMTESYQRAIVKAYFDHGWLRLMEPLCDALQRWKEGLADRSEAEQALDRAYKESCALQSLCELRLDHVSSIIQARDREWFMRWIEEHHSLQGN